MIVTTGKTVIKFNEEEQTLFSATKELLDNIIGAMKDDDSCVIAINHYADFTKDDIQFFAEICDSFKERDTWTLEP